MSYHSVSSNPGRGVGAEFPQEDDILAMLAKKTSLADPVSIPTVFTPIKTAFDTLKVEMQKDPSYAWSWHCNIAMAAQDEGVPHSKANKIAARFMSLCFGVESNWPITPVEKQEEGREAL